MISKKSKISRKFENSSQIKAVLFDMDGVLLDSFEAWCRLFNATLMHFGKKEITRQQFREGAWARGSKVASKNFFDGMAVKKIVEFYCEHFNDYKKYVRKMKDVDIVLKKLKEKGLKLAIISNGFHKLVRIILKMGRLEDYFDIVVGTDDVKNAKPAPDMLLYACKKLGIKPEEAVMIGDTKYDVEAGRNAGCLAVGFKTDGDKRIESLKGLLKIIWRRT